MGEQRHPARLVERRDPVPERAFVGRHIGLPGVEAFVDGLGRGRVAEIAALGREGRLAHRDLHAARGSRVVITLHEKAVQERRHGDMRVVGERLVEREGAMGGEFDHQPFGKRLDAVVLVVLRIHRLAADGDDGALRAGLGRDRTAFGVGLAITGIVLAIDGDGRLVLGTDITACDNEFAGAVDADENARVGDLGSVIDRRAVLEGGQRRLDLAKARIDLIGQLVVVGVFRLEPLIFLAQRLAGGALLVGQIEERGGQDAKAAIMVVGQIGIDLDPLPALGRDFIGDDLQLLRDERSSSAGFSSQPSSSSEKRSRSITPPACS